MQIATGCSAHFASSFREIVVMWAGVWLAISLIAQIPGSTTSQQNDKTVSDAKELAHLPPEMASEQRGAGIQAGTRAAAIDEDSSDPLLEANADVYELFEQSKVPLRFKTKPVSRQNNRCGVVCLYAFLRIVAPGTTYSRLNNIAGSAPANGFSLAELKDIAKSAGCETKVVKCDPMHVFKTDPPAIVHLGEPGKLGHFICIVRRNTELNSTVCIDGSTGGIFKIKEDGPHSIAAMSKKCSGYMLVQTQPSDDRHGAANWIALASVIVVIFATALLFLKSRNHARFIS